MKSTGPRTDEGKNRAEYNAMKHGLTAQTIALDDDTRELYQTHVAGYFERYKPVGTPEENLVQCIADDYWRAMRGRGFEAECLQAGMNASAAQAHPDGATSAPGSDPSSLWLQNAKTLTNLQLYINRIERSIRSNVEALKALQSERKEARREAEQEVIVRARLAYAEKEPFDPAVDFPPERGFVFSAAQVALMVDSADRLKYAKEWDRYGFKRGLEPDPIPYTIPEFPEAA